VALHILFLGVHALGDKATWPPERHSQQRSRRPRLSETPFSLSCPAKRKGQAAALSNPPGPNNRASLGGETIGRHGLEKNVCRVAPFLFLQYIARMFVA
jgi:hypothetical protein